jgi:hypothetical protein
MAVAAGRTARDRVRAPPGVLVCSRMRDRVDADPKGPSEKSRRKPYRTPRLARLGTLTEITAAVANNSNKTDHGGPQQVLRKTS